jgi:hypothetical protein
LLKEFDHIKDEKYVENRLELLAKDLRELAL